MKKEELKKKKNEERLWNLWDNFKYSNNQIIGVPEGEQEEQEIENLLEKIMKEQAGEGNRHTRTGSSESQTSWTQSRTH